MLKPVLSRIPLLLSITMGAWLVTGCAIPSAPPDELVDARSVLGRAQRDPLVQSMAPVELNKAAATTQRAEGLLANGESMAEVSSVAYVAGQQTRMALTVAQAKTDEQLIATAELERERARADGRTRDAERSRLLAATAQMRAGDAQAKANDAQAQASSARAQASTSQALAMSAQAQAGAARQQTQLAERRAMSAEQQAAASKADAAESSLLAGQLQQQLTDLQARPTERGLLVTLGDVLFEFNRAEVKPSAQDSLRKLADFLQRNPDRRILIEGHTDNIGSSAYNDSLSLRRAGAVDLALVAMGLAPQRVTTVGYGKEFPIADNSSDTNRALNRRVEVYIAEAGQSVRSRR